MTTPARAESVLVARRLPAPPERVFEWLTDPAKLARWMTPQGRVVAEADARPGGRLFIVMFDGDQRIEHRGEFLDLDAPRRLAFTWNSPYTDGDSLVTIELVADGDQTLLTLRHERLPAPYAESHAGGWGSMLDRLIAGLRDEAA